MNKIRTAAISPHSQLHEFVHAKMNASKSRVCVVTSTRESFQQEWQVSTRMHKTFNEKLHSESPQGLPCWIPSAFWRWLKTFHHSTAAFKVAPSLFEIWIGHNKKMNKYLFVFFQKLFSVSGKDLVWNKKKPKPQSLWFGLVTDKDTRESAKQRFSTLRL